MQLGVIVGKIISTDKYSAYNERKLLLVQPLGLDRKPRGNITMAIDYVDAGEGDIVLLGSAPGLAATVFGIPRCPMRELIMGVVDRVDLVDQPLLFTSRVPDK